MTKQKAAQLTKELLDRVGDPSYGTTEDFNIVHPTPEEAEEDRVAHIERKLAEIKHMMRNMRWP